ncbi:MAG TPA: hypothetical protein PLM06_02620, partial [Anaerolineae bacterium]|nr:hypothetical protein [Anaerolineae bacterium]
QSNSNTGMKYVKGKWSPTYFKTVPEKSAPAASNLNSWQLDSMSSPDKQLYTERSPMKKILPFQQRTLRKGETYKSSLSPPT